MCITPWRSPLPASSRTSPRSRAGFNSRLHNFRGRAHDRTSMTTEYPVLPTTVIRDSTLNDWMRRKHDVVDLIIASETFQRTGSFKFRAAWNLAQNVASDHLIAASSGNFGQAL